MVDEQSQSSAGTDRGPLQHLQIAVGVAEGGNGFSSDVLIDGDGFADVVVDEIQLRQAGEHGEFCHHFKLCDDAAADNLLGRDTVDLLGKDAHKFNSATGDDKGLEAIGAQIAEQLDHGLENYFGVRPFELRMFGGGDPIAHDGCEFVGGHAGMGEGCKIEHTFFAGGSDGFHIPGEHGGVEGVVAPFRMLGRHGFHAIENEGELKIKWLLAPEGAIVVEDGDALLGLNEMRRAGGCDVRGRS